MAIWEIEHPTTGELFELEQDTAPTDAQVKAILSSSSSSSRPVQSSTGGGAMDWLKRNMELPVGVAGSLAGAAAGSPLGPPGMVVGGIVGGALGSGGGSALSDVMAGDPINMREAAKEAAISAGIDTVTLGVGKVLRPLASAIGTTVSDVVRSLSPKATGIIPSGAPTVGTRESLLQTQTLLEQGGGTLSSAQTGRAGRFRRLSEQLGDIGIFSGARTRQRIAQNASVLKAEVQRQIDGVDSGLVMSVEGLGETLHEIVRLGREANSDIYDKALTDIAGRYGSKQVPTTALSSALNTFERQNTSDFGSTLTDTTQGLLREWRQAVSQTPMASVSSLMSFQKKLNATLSQVSDVRNSGMYNGVASAELAQLSDAVRGAISDTLGYVDKDLQQSFALMNKTFGDAASTLLPKVTQGIIKQADKGAYEALGRMLIKGTSTSQINAFMQSVDEAFRLAKQAGTEISGPVKTAADARAAIRQSYVANVFADVSGSEDIYKAGFRGLADKLENPTTAARARAILGEGYEPYKRLLNAISDASPKNESSMFGLMLRSRESTAAQGVFGAVVGGTGVGVGLPAAAAVFAVPEVLSRIATNRAAVNRLLTLDKATQRGGLAPEVVGALTAKVFEALSVEDREALAEYFNAPQQ